MEESARLWIKDVGFPIFVACLAIYAMYQLFRLREQERKMRDDRLALAIETNTSSTNDLAVQQKEQHDWWKQFGSDPFSKVCKAVDGKVQCKIGELGIDGQRLTQALDDIAALRKQGIEAAQAVAGKTEELKNELHDKAIVVTVIKDTEEPIAKNKG